MPAPAPISRASASRISAAARAMAASRTSVTDIFGIDEPLLMVQFGQETLGRDGRRPWFPGAATVARRQRILFQHGGPDLQGIAHLFFLPADHVDGLAGGGQAVG